MSKRELKEEIKKLKKENRELFEKSNDDADMKMRYLHTAAEYKEEKEMNQHNICINKTAATITSLLGIDSHEGAAAPIEQVLTAANEKFGEKGCDRVFMYNPDAVAMWLYQKYTTFYEPLMLHTKLMQDML